MRFTRNFPLFTILLFCCFAPYRLDSTEIINPFTVLHRHYAAIGGLERLQKQRNSFSEGDMRYDGLKGTFRNWEKRPLQYRLEENLGIISQVEGDDGRQSWFFDTNGQLLLLKDEDTVKRRQLRLHLDHYEHLNPESAIFRVTYGGDIEVNGHSCHEIIITNSINTDRYRFSFDTQSYLLRQTIVTQPDVEVTTEYDDYRWSNGILSAFYSKTVYMPWKKEEESWTKAHQIDIDMDTSLFVPPATDPGYHFTDRSTSAAVPFELLEDLIYLRVEVSGHTDYWVLDSGATMSVIDEEYAKQLGLSREGSINGYGFGELFTLGFTTIPSLQLGSIIFGAHQAYVSEGLRKNSYEPEIVGILGYDFLSRFVVEIDYDQQRATFHKPGDFKYTGKGIRFDAPLKYRTFTLPVTLDQHYTSRWSVDLGSYRSSIHHQFGEKHDLLQRRGIETVSQGMSGLTWETSVQFNCLQIGDFNLVDQLVTIPASRGEGATALGEVGGNLGNSTLRNFHIFLDYPNQQIILEKGKHYNSRFPRDHSGLLIGRGDHNEPMVSFIAANTPAADAGLEAGDIIVGVNGQNVVAGDSIIALRRQLRTTPGKTVHYTVRRNGVLLELDLTLTDLYPDTTKEGGCQSQ